MLKTSTIHKLHSSTVCVASFSLFFSFILLSVYISVSVYVRVRLNPLYRRCIHYTSLYIMLFRASVLFTSSIIINITNPFRFLYSSPDKIDRIYIALVVFIIRMLRAVLISVSGCALSLSHSQHSSNGDDSLQQYCSIFALSLTNQHTQHRTVEHIYLSFFIIYVVALALAKNIQFF